MPIFRNCFALLLAAACAFPSLSHAALALRVKESVAPPREWVQLKAVPAEHTISLRIGLPQRDFDSLERHLYETSDPSHERYGKYLSKEEIESFVAPHDTSLEAVNAWLREHGLEETHLSWSAAKDWVTVTVPIRVAEKMLGTTYHVWKHAASGDQLVRTTSYSLPDDLHEHIEVIQPTTMFARWSPLGSTIHEPIEELSSSEASSKAKVASSSTVDPSCNQRITLSCLQQLYNINGYTPKVPNKGGIGITGYLEQFANEQDLNSFYAEQLPAAVNSSFKFLSVKGGLNNQTLSEAGIEANLDVQYAYGLAYPIRGTFWSTAGRPPFKPDLTTPQNTNEPYADWLDFALAQKDVPLTISTSYGEPEQTVPEAYARRVCKQLAQLTARGVTLLFSSGDFGVGDGSDDPNNHLCFTNDGRNATRFLATFPSTCPYVTSVGGTRQVPEVAVDFTGGGFSDYFPRPIYQAKAVPAFLKTLPKGLYKGWYNSAGRGFPDVAAQGLSFRVWFRGRPVGVGGTSASSPAVAGIIALLNDARFANGMPPLGFVNPLLYAKGLGTDLFNDIVEGNNPGCGTPGFNATKGWDPVTGLGTPNFEKLKDVVTDRKSLLLL